MSNSEDSNRAPVRAKNRSLNIFDDSVLLQPLGPLLGFDPHALIPKSGSASDIERLALTLAIAYNDLKDILTWREMNRELSPPPPDEGNLDKQFGQASGVDWHLFRLICGWLEEVSVLFEKNAAAQKGAEWKAVLMELSEVQRVALAKVLSLTNQSSESRDESVRAIRSYLAGVRANGTFHYYQTKPFARGFQTHFDGTAPNQAKAFWSDGRSLEECRFFFGDAAVMATCQSGAVGNYKDFSDLVFAFARASHIAIRGVVISFLKARGAVFSPVDP